MKKVLSIMLALVMCFALAMPAFAADADSDWENFPTDKVEVPGGIDEDTMGKLMEAIQGVLANVGDIKVEDLGKLIPQISAAVRDALTGAIGEDAMNQIIDFINSNEFLKWLASIYTGSVTTTEAPTTEAPTTTEPSTEETTTAEVETPDTGDSAVALAVLATVSVAAAAAFVCTKKKA